MRLPLQKYAYLQHRHILLATKRGVTGISLNSDTTIAFGTPKMGRQDYKVGILL